MGTCKDCKDRNIGCHITCERYYEFKKEKERINQLKRKNNDLISKRTKILTHDGYWRYADTN